MTAARRHVCGGGPTSDSGSPPFRPAGEDSTLPELQNITQPTLVIGGEWDPLSPAIDSRLLGLLIPDAQLYIDPDAGHSPHTEQPGLDLIQRFLRR